MEVSDHLRFPQANVTIYARELALTGIGCIDTTPLPYAARAESEYLTQDPLDPTNARAPADAQGNPTYRAKDGAQGEPAGNITLYVQRVIDERGNASRKRFICRGGKGQAGEAGGLKQYVAKDGYPDQYGPLKPIAHNEVSEFFKEKNCGRDECWRYRWPGGVDWPNQMKVEHAAGNVLNTGQAVAVTLLTYCDDVGPTAFTPIAWESGDSCPAAITTIGGIRVAPGRCPITARSRIWKGWPILPSARATAGTRIPAVGPVMAVMAG
jgi:hypothetical protein